MYKVISLDDFKNNNLKVDFFYNRIFFKGMISSEPIADFLYFNNTNYQRESKTLEEHGNLYNMLLNELPSWQKLPLRKNSIIFTNNFDTAKAFSIPRPFQDKHYSKLFYVIPTIDSELVISPASDLWYSFTDFFQLVGIRKQYYTLTDLNDSFKILANKFGSMNHDKSLANFEKFISKILKQDAQEIDLGIDINIIYKHIIKSSNKYLEILDENFSPSANNFSTIIINDSVNIPNNREIWTNRDCILVEINEYDKIVDIHKPL